VFSVIIRPLNEISKSNSHNIYPIFPFLNIELIQMWKIKVGWFVSIPIPIQAIVIPMEETWS